MCVCVCVCLCVCVHRRSAAGVYQSGLRVRAGDHRRKRARKGVDMYVYIFCGKKSNIGIKVTFVYIIIKKRDKKSNKMVTKRVTISFNFNNITNFLFFLYLKKKILFLKNNILNFNYEQVCISTLA